METRTIEAYGYTVTGNADIISQIEKIKNDSSCSINWKHYEEGSIFWDLNGFIAYHTHIDHNEKRVILIH